MTREVEMGSHLFVWSGMPNISKMLSETLSQHTARFTTFETHRHRLQVQEKESLIWVLPLGPTISVVWVDVWAGDTTGTTTRESAHICSYILYIYSETSGCEHPESVNTPYSEHFSPVPVFF